MIHEDPIVRVAQWNNLAVVEVAGEVGVEHVRNLEKAYQKVIQQYPDGIVILCIIRPETPVAKTDVRAEFARMLKALGASVKRQAVLLEHGGAMATLLRTVVVGLNVLIRNPVLYVCANDAECAKVLAPLVATPTQGKMGPEVVVAAIQQIRKEFEARRGKGVRMAS